jgi:hypothetical protein
MSLGMFLQGKVNQTFGGIMYTIFLKIFEDQNFELLGRVKILYTL